jgi:hypothetical protein
LRIGTPTVTAAVIQAPKRSLPWTDRGARAHQHPGAQPGARGRAPLHAARAYEELSLLDFAAAIREGAFKLVVEYGFSQAAAEKISQGGPTLALDVEACDLPTEAVLELNVGPPQVQVWKELDDLSAGQKATAALLLLLLESTEPLIIDQPEDDLDNRFIAEAIVPAMRGREEQTGKRPVALSLFNRSPLNIKPLSQDL